MIIVLDSNEYINFLNKRTSLGRIFETNLVTIHANELIAKEVLRNVSEEAKKEFYALLMKDNVALHSEKLPMRLLKKYRERGLKKGDIEIAAFCENISASYLVSENRHFLEENKFDEFNVITLQELFKLL